MANFVIFNECPYVNPFIGTDFTGNTYPGAQVPFGMVQLSPDNGLPGWDRISGYFYPDSTIAGFSHTHLSGTGAGDLYDISFMPVTLPYKEAEEPLGIHSRFSHADEAASAGYYRVLLKDYGINVELTATERCGIQRYTFPEADAAVILNLRKAMNWDFTEDSYIEKVDSVTIQGYRFSDGWARGQRIFFCTRFSRPFETMQLDSAAVLKDGKRIGTSVIARFDFKTTKGEQLLVSTAISGVSMEGAARNLAAEVPDDDFDKYLAAARKNWNGHLSRIEIECDNHDEKVKFYTALYHSMLAPTIYADVDGSYYGPDKQIHKADGWTNYSTFSLWDTYRASHPLYTYIEPARVNDMVKSFLAFYEQNGRLPVWNFYGSETDMMIGYHSVPVIVDACLKGIGDFDAKIDGFSPDDYTPHICESNGWQYFWSVQQDIDGLIALIGGKERFAQKLDSMFTYRPADDEELPIFSTGMIGQYAHGNEPSHHVIYLFNKVGQPWKTQKYASEVMRELYKNTPAGLCGNEDCGQMSAWYVFSAMGFYPVNPVGGEYEIGTPLYPEVRMRLSNGKTFTVLAHGVSGKNRYIQSVKLDGKPYDKSYITHEQIMNGSILEFEMGSEPGKAWY